MLPRQHRLPLRKERHRIEQNGLVRSFPHFTLYFLKRDDPSLPSRFAILVSKKLFPKAVDRNLFRRRVLHQLHGSLPLFHSGYDFLIIPRAKLTQLKTSELKKVLTNTLSIVKID